MATHLASTVAVGLLLAAHGLCAQPVGRCPDQPGLRQRVDRVCMETLPYDARVHFRTANGGTCYCTCDTLINKTVKEIDELRVVRARRYAHNIRKFSEQVGDSIVRGAPGKAMRPPDDRCSSDLVEVAEGMERCGVLTCDADDRLDKVLSRISASGFSRPSSILSFFVNFYPDADECGELFPWKQGFSCAPDAPDNAVCPNIHVPSSFIRHPAVGEELLMFMILHEIGHGVADEETAFQNCEANADAWAIEVGFNAVYGEGLGEAVDLLVDQFDKFYRDIFTSSTVEQAKVNGGQFCYGSYPALRCRTNMIQQVASVETPMELERLGEFVQEYLTANNCWEPLGGPTFDPAAEVHCGDCPDLVIVDPWWYHDLWFPDNIRLDQRILHMCEIHPCLCLPRHKSCFPPALLKDLHRLEGDWINLVTRLEKIMLAKPIPPIK